ncbi:MAG: FecR domain-containing protein, partial [Spirochaetia bacterium]
MTKTPSMRLFAALAVFSLLGAAAVWADPPSQVGRLSLISGAVSFHPGSLDEWAPATLNYPLSEGDHLWTDNGARAEVQLLTAAIRLNSVTEFSFLALDDQTVQVRLTEGSVNVDLRSVDEGTTFEVDTPNAAVALPVAGSYRIDVTAGGETSVTARSGTAQVLTGGDSFDVPGGQAAVVSGTDSVAYYVTGAPAPDEWDAWCDARDQRAVSVSSNPYVSREMIGADDLNDNGSWIVAAGYGPAWVPSRVPAGWAPYRYGH